MNHLSSSELDRNLSDLEPGFSGNNSDQIQAFIEPTIERDYQDFHEEGFFQSLQVFGGRFTNEQAFEL